MASLGQDLRRERESRSITLEEISKSSRIGLRYLQAIEADKYDTLPGRFFVRGVLRTYALAVGLDEGEILARFDKIEGHAPEVPAKPQRKQQTWIPSPSRFRAFPVAAVSISVLVVIALLYLFVFKTEKKNRPPAEQAIPASIVQVQETPPQVKAPVPEEPKDLTLELSFQEETWIQVFADGEIKLGGLKYPGQTSQVKAKSEILIHLGNAGGLSYVLNGKKGRSLGGAGVVVRNIKMTMENYKNYQEDTSRGGPGE